MNIEESIEILKNIILMPDGWIIGKDYKGNLEFIGCPEGQEAIETLLTAYEKEKEKNSKAIGHIEVCKTSLGNYILSPNETEYLLEILKEE